MCPWPAPFADFSCQNLPPSADDLHAPCRAGVPRGAGRARPRSGAVHTLRSPQGRKAMHRT
eukprot:986350-Pyramimonas_sp.AAC.1